MLRAQKIVVVGSLDTSLLNFRGSLLRDMVGAGHEVVAVSPAQNPSVPPALAALGVRFVPIALGRTGLNPLADLVTRQRLQRLLERERPSLVLAYTIKPIVLGIPAAAHAGVPKRFALITGLGAAFNTPGVKGWLLRRAASRMYRAALKLCTRVIVQNSDIERVLRQEGVLSERMAVSVVPGSGIDTARFESSAVPAGSPVYLMLARMLVDKGIREFVAAARIVRQKCEGARFLVVGGLDTNPSAILKAELDLWNMQGVVEFCPAVVDVRPLIQECSIYVLPSYHEGLPRSVLEAMSVGRPVITTDAIGCRDTILEPGPIDAEGVRTGKNGMLVPVRNVPALAAAMLRLAGNPQIAESMGRSGRAAAELFFDVRRVNDLMLGAMGLLAPQEGQPPIARSL